MPFRTPALLLCLLALSACDATEPRTISGTFEATEQIDVSTVTTAVVLPTIADGETFAFATSLTITRPDQDPDTETLAGSGTYSHPTLTLTAQGETVTGTVSEDGESITLQNEDGDLILARR